MERCVLIYVEAHGEFLVIKKKRGPECVIGKYNLIGGHIEPNETVVDAAKREFHEETGARLSAPKHVGIYCEGDFEIHVFTGDYIGTPVSATDEEVSWVPIESVFSSRLGPNLDLIIPLCRHGQRGWQLVEGVLR